MVSRIIKVDPFDLIVFGGTGDLAYRKLFPALFRRYLDGQFSEPTRIIAAARHDYDAAAFRHTVAKALHQFASEATKAEAIDAFLSLVDYVALDIASDGGWDALAKKFPEKSTEVRAFYLATGPDRFGAVAAQLAAYGLITPGSRIIVEKPIGRDSESAAKINDALGSVFHESQIYRIDHYLGKETVQNLLALRFANALFEPLWNAAHIDHVQITVAETVGVEGRGPYYETAGALRDMVQNHLLQLLCLVAMEPPAAMDAGRRARREAESPEVAGADRRQQCGTAHRARPVSRRRQRRRRRAGLPR